MAKKERIGTVVSTACPKTIVVVTERLYPHKRYNKILTKTKRYKAHDEEITCKNNDIVIIEECRPISRHKTWTLKKIVKTATQEE
jgi:small subunit ribosomal protein S17